MKQKNYNITIGWLYPALMSTYGDRGNIIVLQKRCEWRGIKTQILPIDQTTSDQKIKSIDLLFGGGAQDREQEIVIKDLHKKKKIITQLIEQNIPSLFVCGSPQLMGTFYEPSAGKRIEGLGIFDMESKHPGPMDDRLIGNIVADVSDFLDTKEITWEETLIPQSVSRSVKPKQILKPHSLIVGFENHGGRTYLGKNAKSFAKVIKGNGNNGKDGTEGCVYKNAIGCYFHGPLLPKNPEIADWLIKTALEVKYKEKIKLEPLDNSLEHKAKEAILKRLGITLSS